MGGFYMFKELRKNQKNMLWQENYVNSEELILAVVFVVAFLFLFVLLIAMKVHSFSNVDCVVHEA